MFVPFGTHTLNIVVADAARSSTNATAFFGHVQKLFNLFSAATQRWNILTKHVKITLKSWNETRWESCVKSVEAIRFQAAEIQETLLEVSGKATDPVVRIKPSPG